jgi:hypothetical protein
MRPWKKRCRIAYVHAHAGLGVGGGDDSFVEDEGERGQPLLVVHHLLGRLLEPIKLPRGNNNRAQTDQRSADCGMRKGG